ncbi:hypothetical protein LZC95_35210 [Pendulispora brunnea]|uniref:Response regulatory domain-containing protein n=1 Tax=Pendulispora brunnea TaxID=2905690 RepID=A0ABZ2K4G3_9BACT
MPKNTRRKSQGPLYVSIVSTNRETVDMLKSYLDKAGVPCHGTRAIDGIELVAPACANATVIFPDDFPDADVLALVKHIRRARPRLLTLLVTNGPQRFRDLVATDGRSIAPLVLPRPSFGWDILDAIRAHVDMTGE